MDMKWDDSYSVGIESLDRQHKKYFDLANRWIHDIMAGEGEEAVKYVLNELREFARTHFKDEERLMRAYNYPDYEKHAKEHMRMFDKILELSKDYDDGDVMVCVKVTSLLIGWFETHMKNTDREYAPFLRSKGVS